MTEPSARPIRIGNAERDAAVKALDEHLAAGRLDVEEYGERYAKALVARTHSELAVLFEDLPGPGPIPVAAPSPEKPRMAGRPNYVGIAAGVVAMMAVLPVIALVLFLAVGAWWVFFLIPVMGRFVAYRGWRGYDSGYRRDYRRYGRGCWG